MGFVSALLSKRTPHLCSGLSFLGCLFSLVSWIVSSFGQRTDLFPEQCNKDNALLWGEGCAGLLGVSFKRLWFG